MKTRAADAAFYCIQLKCRYWLCTCIVSSTWCSGSAGKQERLQMETLPQTNGLCQKSTDNWQASSQFRSLPSWRKVCMSGQWQVPHCRRFPHCQCPEQTNMPAFANPIESVSVCLECKSSLLINQVILLCKL